MVVKVVVSNCEPLTEVYCSKIAVGRRGQIGEKPRLENRAVKRRGAGRGGKAKHSLTIWISLAVWIGENARKT